MIWLQLKSPPTCLDTYIYILQLPTPFITLENIQKKGKRYTTYVILLSVLSLSSLLVWKWFIIRTFSFIIFDCCFNGILCKHAAMEFHRWKRQVFCNLPATNNIHYHHGVDNYCTIDLQVKMTTEWKENAIELTCSW